MKKNKNLIIILIIGIILIGGWLTYFYQWRPCFEGCTSPLFTFCNNKGCAGVLREITLKTQIICGIRCFLGI